MVIDTFAEPLERTYDKNDLLTKIYHINPNWKPGDPEDYRYIESYIDEGYTGFLPIHLKINPPNFVHQWGIEGSNGLTEWKSLPILENGKYKYYYNSGQEGLFGLGFVPVKRYNQNTDDYDFSVNIKGEVIQNNIATLKITDGVLSSVLDLENGILNLPSSYPALNQATEFNTNGKNYATGVSIDLNNLTYYSSMPQIDNGIYGNEIPINQNNVTITLLDDNEDKTDIEHTITYNNPSPTKRSIKAVNLLKDNKTREVTASDIVGYINVNIPPPNITNTIENNGYYKFNSNWNGLIEGTEQDHALSVKVNPDYYLIQDQSFTLTQNPQTFTINDSYNENILPTIDTLNQLNRYISTGYGGNSSVFYYSRSYDQQYLDRILSQGGSNQYWYAYGTTSTNLNTNTSQGAPNILGFNLGASIKIKNIEFYMTGASREFYLLGSNDINFYDTMINMNDNGTLLNYINNNLTPSNIIWHKTDIPVSNNVFHKEYKIFDDNPSYKNYVFVFMTTDNGRNWVFINGLKFISNFKNAMKSVTITSNLPTVNNADVDSQNNNIITTRNGTYTIPSGKTGWNSFSINVPSDVNNYNGYTSINPLVINNNSSGTITIPEGFSGLGEIHFTVTEPKKRAVKCGLTYSSTKYLISNLSNAGGNYWIHRYYGEGNTTQVFINPTENKVISLASSGNAWELYVPSTYKHVELGTGNNDTTDYYLCLYDENDVELYRLRNETGNGGNYTQYTHTVPSDIEIIA